MKTNDLIYTSKLCHGQLLNALSQYVRENGEEMSKYFYDEFGMDEEDEEGVKIVRVLDLSRIGCFFSRQSRINDEGLRDIYRNSAGSVIFDKIEISFVFSAFWALYIVEENGEQRLKYYRFYNDGVCYQEDCEPDHDYATHLSVPDLYHIYWAIIDAD